jgi:hypothetical protein
MNPLKLPVTQSRLHATTRTTPRHVSFSIVGATVGLVLFLVVALLPSLLYGGVAGVRVVTGFFGAPGAHPLVVEAFAAFGIVLSVTAVGALFASLGAVAGASVGALAGLSAGEKG